MRNRFCHYFLAALALSFNATVSAEDVDLFVGLPPDTTSTPNVLFMVDNTANWNTAFTNEMAVLVSTFTNMAENDDGTAKFNVGVMLANETGNPNNNTKGGYIRAAIRPMDTTNKALYAEMFNRFDVGDDKGNGGKSGLQMAEAYRYFAGGAVYAGNGKVKTDYTGNTGFDWKNNTYTAESKTAMQAIYALTGNALDSFNASTYNSPIPANFCGKNYIIYVSNGSNQESNSDDTIANNMLSAAGGSTTEIPISPTGSQGNPSDEWAKFMKSELNVTTYTVDVDKVLTGQGPGWTALLKSMKDVSGGKYFDVSSGAGGAEISGAFDTIFSEILSVNSVFASVSLPVSVNTQGTYLNQVYVGMFRPDDGAMPRWMGNMKQYKLGMVDNALKLLDADDTGAINSQTGFVTECARSFWTPTSTDDYWAFRPQRECLAVADAEGSNYPDGPIVEKGAQAYKLRGAATTRTVKTCSATFASCTSWVDFDSSVATQALLGAGSTAERDELINWQKGLDVDDEKPNSITTDEGRPSAHGDVVHSRPVAINYGTDAAPQVVVYYGGNDGLLHAINGNRSAAIDSVAAGEELWSFVPPEFFGYIKRIRDNTVQIDYFGNATTSPAPLPKPYGVDGTVTAYRGEPTLIAGVKTWIYATMRRGGRVVYAFDVTTPAAAFLKWKKGCPNNFPTTGTVSDADCSSGFTGIGQTWSAPMVFTASGYATSGHLNPLLIMSGGYDTCEDDDSLTAGGANHSCTSSNKGDKIYILDADTGAPVKSFDTDRGVVGDVFLVRDFDDATDTWGPVKYAYAADLGGNIYRLSGVDANSEFSTTTPANWTITKIASLGCSTPSTCTANRKFMFGPDVVWDGSSYVLLIGSGDREKPLDGYVASGDVSNRFFMIKDQPADTSWLSSENATCGSDIICTDSLYAITTTSDPSESDLAGKKGWYLAMDTGEQVVTSAITVFGAVTFSTHTPAVPVAGSCTSNLGTARVYNVDYTNASGVVEGVDERYQEIAGGGLPPSPIAGMVTLDDGSTVPFVIGSSPESPIESASPTATGGGSMSKGRVYWYIQR